MDLDVCFRRGSSYSDGWGSGDGSSYGDGDGCGDGYDYGDGSGTGFDSGYGSGTGYGSGSGFGSGDGDGSGDGSGHGSGDGDDGPPDPWDAAHALALADDLSQLPPGLDLSMPEGCEVARDYALAQGLRTIMEVTSGY